MDLLNSPLLGLVAYLVLIAGVAIWTFGKNTTKDDFILGGRKLGAWVIALSERTAAESAWLILGLSGALYAVGMLEVWTVIGCVLGIIFYIRKIDNPSGNHSHLGRALMGIAGAIWPIALAIALYAIFPIQQSGMISGVVDPVVGQQHS